MVSNAAPTRRKRHGRKPKNKGLTESPKLSIWTPAETRRIFLGAVKDERLAILWRVAVMTGMRRAELSELRWKDVNLKEGTIEVRHTLTAVHRETPEGEPKPKRGHAVELVDGEPKAAQAKEKLAFPGSPFNKAGLVFVSEEGLPLDPDQLSRAFARARKTTELPAIRLHDLRHSHAWHLLAAGVPIHVVS